jgi:hypothetical protein
MCLLDYIFTSASLLGVVLSKFLKVDFSKIYYFKIYMEQNLCITIAGKKIVKVLTDCYCFNSLLLE